MVERRSPKPEVGGSIPSAPAKKNIRMINPFKFVQSVKQEAFKVTWASRKEVLLGSMMVLVLSSIAAVFFLLLDQIYKFFLDLMLTINF